MANKRFIVKNGLDNSGDNSVVNTITNVAEPTNNSDAATKYYVDTHSSGGTVTAVTGTLPVESTGGTAPDISLGTASNGQLLIGTGTGFTKSTLTQGTGVTITNASGAITIAATGSGGDVVGPASSTDNAIVRFDLTTGKLIQNSTATLSDGGIMIVTELDTDSIKSATANSPIVIAPDGTGDVHLNADSVRIGDNNADATIATRGTGDLIITTHEGSANEGIVRLYDGVNGDITLTPNGTGQVKVGTDQVVTLVASQTLTNKTISGSANTLSNIANASLTNSTISGVALGSNLNALTISSPLTGTSFNGSAAVSIGIPVATTSVNGYLSSADWTTFNNKGSGSVTSVAATVPSLLSISGSPITTSGTLAITYSGTALPVANGGTGLTTLTAGYIPYGAGTSAFGSSANLFWDSANSRLGIGTTSPVTKLNILGSTAASGELGSFAISGSTTAKRLTFGVDSTGTMYGWIQSVESGVGYQDLNLQPLGGNVGIGTATSSGLLTLKNNPSGSAENVLIGLQQNGASTGTIGKLSYQQSDDTMRLYNSSSFAGSALILGTNNTERLRIDSSGNVGIGTASPAAKLEVYNSSANAETILRGGANNFGGVLSFYGDISGGGNYFRSSISGINEASSGSALTFATTTNGNTTPTERVRIDRSGNVGIGTASPSAKLTVIGSAAKLYVDLSGENYYDASVHSFRNFAGSEGMRLNSTGLGIGTASPSQKLHIAGTTANLLLAGTSSSYATFNVNSANIGYVGDANWMFGGSSSDFGIRATNNLVFGTSFYERMRIDSSGNVGIGTASPVSGLDVRKTPYALSSENGISLGFSSGSATVAKISFETDSSGVPDLSLKAPNDGNARIKFYTGATPTERMRIDPSGNVGIGGTPAYKLDVNGTTFTTGITISTGGGTNVANTVNIDTNGSGTARYYSHGSNSSTKGSHEFHLASSNGSLDVIGMSLDTSGNLTNTGVFKGNSGTKGFGGITTTTSTSTPTGGSSGDHYYIY